MDRTKTKAYRQSTRRFACGGIAGTHFFLCGASRIIFQWSIDSSTVFWALQCPLVEGVWHYYTAELEEPKTCSYMNEDSVTNLTQDDFQRLLQERITYGSRLQHIYGLDFPLLPV